ncbi:hypothetical protein N9A94_00635 [Akkermansiaceae bacterium]|nr:hypothetical protein [Akkermansiaceae bacterium]MDA7888136.1 hypothetical protein [Akkermansiaceae bacterium]
MEFCKEAGAGGNHVIAITASGHMIGDQKRGHVKLNEKDLAPLLAAYQKLPNEIRKPKLPDPSLAEPPNRPVPQPPRNGLIIRGYCTYLELDDNQSPRRAKRLYYQRNPDSWAAETQNDMLWLTEAEWQSLLPKSPTDKTKITVPKEIQRRFFTTIGIDYMEGSVNALPLRESSMTLTLEESGTLRLDGYGKMGQAFGPDTETANQSRGCELRVTGTITYDPKEKKITTFNLAGAGRAWGNKMNYTNREITLPTPKWHYGIACELVSAKSPDALIPPYNMIHYGGRMKYFGGK